MARGYLWSPTSEGHQTGPAIFETEYGMGNETQTKASSHRCTRMMTYYKGLHHDKIIIRVVNYVRFFIKVMKMSNMKQWNKLKL
ncbi:hypothetical protein CMV_024816 [Castanea mollissima]|uniref:Uncharacterized protein n=1 Tax=Castanea mollissima TaxID=60419 RepID=A0A8J4QLZ0_9ROSI|nr:hypothetical protein CMV_024816 [Castanea mollissima]